MKLNKSLITCAVMMALGAGQSAFAQTKQISNEIQSDLMINAVGNVIELSQTSGLGATFGNEVIINQEGDQNGTDISVDGDDNLTDVTQLGQDNLALSTSTGDGNEQLISQDGELNQVDNTIRGNDNYIEVSQEGGGYLGIGNQVINVVDGESNTVTVEQGDGGHWAYNRNMKGRDRKSVV